MEFSLLQQHFQTEEHQIYQYNCYKYVQYDQSPAFQFLKFLLKEA